MRSRQRPVVLRATCRISLVRNQPKHNWSVRSCHGRRRYLRRRCLLRRASSDESAGSSQRDEPASQVAHLLSPSPPGTRPAARRVRDFASYASTSGRSKFKLRQCPLPSPFRSTRFAMVVLQVRPVIIQLLEPFPGNPDRQAGFKGSAQGLSVLPIASTEA